MPVTTTTADEVTGIALKTFLEKGIQAVSMHQLAVQAGISTKTLYKFFNDKAALIRSCLIIHYANLANDVDTIIMQSEGPMHALIAMLDHFTNIEFEVNPVFYSDLNNYYPDLQNEVILQKEMNFEQSTGILSRAQNAGLLRNDISLPMAMISMHRLYDGITRDRSYEGIAMKPKEIVRQNLLIFIRGMCTATGLEQLEIINSSN